MKVTVKQQKGQGAVPDTRTGRRKVWRYVVLAGFCLPVLLVLAFAVRLAVAPLSISVLGPHITNSSTLSDLGLSVELADISAQWDVRSSNLSLVAKNARVGSNGALLQADSQTQKSTALIPRIKVDLAILPLAIGKIEPRAISVYGPEIKVFLLAARATANETPAPFLTEAALRLDAPAFLNDLINALEGRPNAAKGLSRLASLSLIDPRLDIVETGSNARFHFNRARFDFKRKTAGLEIKGAGVLTPDQTESQASIQFEALSKPDGHRHLNASFDGLNIASFFSHSNALSRLSGVDIALGGNIAITAPHSEDKAVTVDLDLKSTPGTVRFPPFYPEVRAFDEITLRAHYASAGKQIFVRSARLPLGDSHLDISGEISLFKTGIKEAALTAELTPLSIPDLIAYWPEDIASGGKRWIGDNITAGQIMSGFLKADLSAADDGSFELLPDDIVFEFEFENLKAHVLRPMPPLLQAGGRGRLDVKGLRLQVEEGHIDGLPVSRSEVYLFDFDKPRPQWADIDLRVAGPLPNVLRLIDYEPLGFSSAFGIDPSTVDGKAQVRANLRFPLLKSLALADVDIDLDGTVSELLLRDLVGKTDLTHGDLRLAVTGETLQAHGSARLGSIFSDISWREVFSPEDGVPSSEFRVNALVDARELSTLGLDLSSYLSGPFPLKLSLRGNGPAIQSARLDADLDSARLSVPTFGWKKEKDRPATLSLDVFFDENEGARLENIMFSSGEDAISGWLTVGKDGEVRHATIDRLVLGAMDMRARYTVTEGSDTHYLSLSGRQLDLRPLLKTLGQSKAESNARQVENDLYVDAAIDRVIGHEGEVFGPLALSARREEGTWTSGALDLDVGGAKPLNARLGSDFDGKTRLFSLASPNFGALMRGSGFFRNFEGGDLTVEARIEQHEGTAMAVGSAELRDFKLVQSSRFNAALKEEAPDRFEEFVGKEGIVFSKMTLPFRYENGVIDVDGARANGPSLGLTLEGQIDDGFENVNMNGLIVPAYRLNAVLGKIPLIGGIFSGGEGGGLFAFSYRVKGPAADPDISVNALTALMPGILRKPFEGEKGLLEEGGEEADNRIRPPDEERDPLISNQR